MSTRVSLENFPSVYRRDMAKLWDGMHKVCYLAAAENIKVVSERTPVDTGFAKASNQAKQTENGGDLFNTAPYFGVLEAGARPHAVSEEGQRKIALWAMRKGYAKTWREAMGIAYRKSQNLLERGQAPLWIYQKSLKEMRQTMMTMMDSYIKRFS